MIITKTINYNASLADANDIGYVVFTGSIDENSVPATSYYINDKEVYKNNVKEFRAGLQEFQNAVFADADAQTVQAPDTKEA